MYTSCKLYSAWGLHTPFSKIKGSTTEKLAMLNSIKERRLKQPHDSPYRMEQSCDLLPDRICDEDLETTVTIEGAQCLLHSRTQKGNNSTILKIN